MLDEILSLGAAAGKVMGALKHPKFDLLPAKDKFFE